jgi:hypothetical protein
MEKFIVTSQSYQMQRHQVFGMDEETARRRKYLVKEIKKGVYEALQPFDFKRGEILELDPKLINKKTLTQVVEKTAFERQEAEKPLSEQIKRLTTAQLSEFYFLNCGESEFPQDQDLTNSKRRELILEWYQKNKPDNAGADNE